ncbi:MAG: protein kinase [Chromatiaceae bacterium]|nr:protein kinase [Chromatiaceae bacterium]
MDIETQAMPEIPGYRTLSILGEGGMSTVYLAVQESLNRYAALKILNQMLVVDAEFRKRFLNEGRLIAQMSHPGIITVYDIGAADPYYYLSMTYLPGGTLRDKIRDGLGIERAIQIAISLVDALGYAHRQGIIHRDIKPGNVLFTARDDPVLSDFGIAKSIAAETQITATAMAIGSAKFMSPEQIRGESVDQRSDLYSFGVLLWQLLTGGFPYESHDPFALALKHANDPIPRLPEQLSRFQQLLDRLLAKRPEERFGSAEELAQALAAISLAGLLPTAKGEADLTVVLPNRERPPTPETGADSSVPTAQPIKLQNRPGSLFALGAVAVLVVVVGYVAYRHYLRPVTQDAGPTPPRVTQPVTPPKELPPRPKESKLKELLARAQTYWQEGRLLEPAGDNAFETYRQIVALDPENETATKRLVEIGRSNLVRQKLATATRFVRAGDLTEAGRQVALGLRMDPDNADLSALQEEIRGALVGRTEETRPADRVADLLRVASEQWAAGRLVDPRGENAFETYRRVLDLDPTNALAKQKLVEIGRINGINRVYESARQLQRTGNLSDALQMIETGLKMSPHNERLLQLRETIEGMR